MSNSKSKFLETSITGNIDCPACGNPMSMREFASYQLVFTSKSRQALNIMVDHYVNFLTFFDEALNIHDQYGLDSIPIDYIPFQVGDEMDKWGFYKSDFAESVKIICKSQESLGVLSKISTLPRTIFNPEPDKIKDCLVDCLMLIYGQFAPYDYTAALFEIVDQQYSIRNNIKDRGKISEEEYDKFSNHSKPVQGNLFNIGDALSDWGKLIDNLFIVAPGYAKYLGYILSLCKKMPRSFTPTAKSGRALSLSDEKDTELKTESNINISDEEIEKCIMKITHVINVFFCGGYIEHDSIAPEPDGANMQNAHRFIRPYRFGLNSIIRDWETLGKFITSHVALKIFEPYWPPNFINSVKSQPGKVFSGAEVLKKLSEESEPGSPKNAPEKEKLLTSIGKEEFLGVVSTVVDFACRGKSMTLPNHTVKTKVFGGKEKKFKDIAKNWVISSICGWFPTDRDAHSLVLMGGTGSGKSSIAQSGIVSLSDSLSQFGYSLSFPGPVDEVLFDFYHINHYAGKMPDATEEGARYTMTLGLQPINDPKSKVDLVFTDIAGEKFESALLGGAEDPVVLGALKSAETFVYLFDFVSWKTFAATLQSDALSENWTDFNSQRKKLNKDSRAVRDSFEMLKAVVDKIYQIRRKEGNSNPYENADNCTFVLAFPKSDLYWDSENKFLSEFFEVLKNANIIIETLSSGQGSYASRGISKKAIEKLTGKENEGQINPDDVLRIARKISNEARESLNSKFKETFDPSKRGIEYIESLALPSVMSRGIVEFLQERFKNVYFLPVSAQGKEDKTEGKTGNEGATFDKPPAQVLCEFLFLIAIASALKQNTSSPKQSTSDSDKENNNE